jgi:hypothetical protein
VFLTAEHNEIDKLMLEFDRSARSADAVGRGKAALRICHALEILAATKHEVFYPAADAVLAGEEKVILAETRAGHDDVQRLIDEVKKTSADTAAFGTAVAALARQAGRSMRREEDELFPRLRHSKLDLAGTGERLAARKAELETKPMDRRTIREARKVLGGDPL